MSDEIVKMEERLEQLKSEIDIQSAWLDIIAEKVALAEKMMELLSTRELERAEKAHDAK